MLLTAHVDGDGVECPVLSTKLFQEGGAHLLSIRSGACNRIEQARAECWFVTNVHKLRVGPNQIAAVGT